MTETTDRTEAARPEEPRGLKARLSGLVGRPLAYGTNAVVASLLVLALLGFVDALAAKHSWRVDLTATGRYTLAPQSVKVVRTFKEPVKATAFFGEAQPGRHRFDDLMGQYAYHTSELTYEVIDTGSRPQQSATRSGPTGPSSSSGGIWKSGSSLSARRP